MLTRAEAVRRITADRGLLLARAGARTPEELVEPYRVDGQPLGDACESLRDLVAHVLMWDEINLAVLGEARRGRRHWSLDPRWETREAGAALNRAGVAAGALLPVDLLLHRFGAVRDALVDELNRADEAEWTASTGPLAQYVMTVPTYEAHAFRHAAIHLREL